MRSSDWSSDVCASDLALALGHVLAGGDAPVHVRQAQQLRYARVLAVGQSRRYARLVPALHVRVRLLQGLLDLREIGTRLGAVRLRIETGQDAHADREIGRAHV